MGPSSFRPLQAPIVALAHAAMGWLVSQQEADGNIVPAVDPWTSLPRYDPVRSSFAAGAMAAYLLTHPRSDAQYLVSVRRHIQYQAARLERPGVPRDPLEYCYAGEEALTLWELTAERAFLKLAVRWGTLLRRYDLTAGGPLLSQHAATLLLRLAAHRSDVRKDAVFMAEHALREFESLRTRDTPMPLAHFAELVNVMVLLADVTADPRHNHAALAVADWLLSFRRPSGSLTDVPFPYTAAGGVAYASATAKIIEILPLAIRAATTAGQIPDPYQAGLDEAIVSLAPLQYDAENTYGISPAIRAQLIGGVRNHARLIRADVDTVGHLLLGLSRLLQAATHVRRRRHES